MERAERIGRWVSGVGHVGVLTWAAFGGALFGPQPSPPLQMTQVATMTEAEFQSFAAVSRGAGPVQGQAQEVAALPQPAAEDLQSGALEASQSPEPEAEAQPLPDPSTAEDAPDLTDLAAAPQAPAGLTTALPQPDLPAQPEPEIEEARPTPPAPAPQPETTPTQPETLQNPAAPDSTVETPAQPAPPRSELALDNSPRPRGRPDGLVENRNRRLAEAAEEARRQAAAEQARQDAAAQAEREAAEEAAQARARAEAEAARAAEEAAQREAEEARRDEEERLAAEAAEAAAAEAARAEAEQAAAEEERLAAEEAERQRQEEERLAAEQAEQERLEREAAEQAEQAERDRIAAEEAERARQEAAAAEQAVRDADAAAEVARRRAEEAAPSQDALAAALSEALGDASPGGASDPSDVAADGPPLSLSEREGFRLAIDACWRVGTLSREAQGTSVSVAFSMSPDGMPEPATMRLMGHSGGGPAAAQQAYDFARNAILNCAGTGYELPAEKYNRWKEVIVDFHPGGVGVQ
ncbi:protein TolA [Paracoccus tegillarcae]|uniref:Protein TolA n=1 Tax=Paracoccus tegillarcae TaxID=1529068 RepID=A0A2K9EPA7_9RHOB|nr:protein TolA [Paracoccus tegillarcae]AUH32536.1 protein TolA [Paracoccus tegillarcae]